MNLELKRVKFGEDYTIGHLSVDGRFLCYTLEDKVREVIGEPVSSWKVQNQTAIPKGVYPVIITMSARFRTRLPLLMDVPGSKVAFSILFPVLEQAKEAVTITII